ncbi:hypothetical protein NUW58_g1438 [Xylaria curta]|uniref:Uncharacterized protein n=1 Tax=Xylaria curta TaxID=42375 RepID=A0ACC1PLT6_9PEZI|nr:hypothetical protein NUW58_g1438 [Xylaria curta]
MSAEIELDHYRERAPVLGGKGQATEAYERGDGATAKQLSNEGKRHASEADKLFKKASKVIFDANNRGIEEDAIDLHGQYVTDAERIVTDRIRHDQRAGKTHLHVIVGQGHHSVDHKQKIRPAIEQLCDELGLKYAIEENAGRIYVNLKGDDITHVPLPQHGGHQHHPQQNYVDQQQHYSGQHQQHHGGHNQEQEQYDDIERFVKKLVDKFCCVVIRKLDLRPLMAEPPNISELPKDPNNEDIDELEKRYNVYVYDFSPEAADAKRLKCSLCALLLRCLDKTNKRGWLGYMKCVCTLRPRFDRFTSDGQGAMLIHREQIWVEFQPINREILLEMVDAPELGATGRRGLITSIADPDLLRSWLKICDTKHSHPDIPGTALSRMQAIISNRIFRAVNTSTGSVEILTSLPKFAALSYVWGSDSGPQKNRPLEGGPVLDYSPTIRDSIIMARSLGYEWLWADRACIDQNSKQEKAELIPFMKDIYTAADLTIVAACTAWGMPNGLHGSQNTPRYAEAPIIIAPSVAVSPILHPFQNQINSSVWNSRGWTFQEHVFSRRLLFVFNTEMAFSCGQEVFRETTGCRPVVEHEDPIPRWGKGMQPMEGDICNAERLQKILRGKAVKTEEMLNTERFVKSVEEYCRRDLTVHEDRVLAFGGVILAATGPIDQASEQAFLRHGHPLRFCEALLAWKPGLASGPCFHHKKTTTVFSAPSWSWASTGRQVDIEMEIAGSRGTHEWLHCSQLPNHDILGLPTNTYEEYIDHLLDVPLPDELIGDQSWAKSLPHVLDPSREEESTTKPAFTSVPHNKLHILTLVFDARVVRGEHPWNGHIVMTLEDGGATWVVTKREYLKRDATGEWRIREEYEHKCPCDGWSPRPQRPPFGTFAIITGHTYPGPAESNDVHFHLAVMLLHPEGQQDTYSRLGVSHLTEIWKGSQLIETIKRGRPRWQYIHLI